MKNSVFIKERENRAGTHALFDYINTPKTEILPLLFFYSLLGTASAITDHYGRRLLEAVSASTQKANRLLDGPCPCL